jgi:hypothetical protein
VALEIIKGRKIKRKEFLLNCIKYENEREGLVQKLYFIRGNIKLDLDILLEVNSPDMENILPALADFIEETDRFKNHNPPLQVKWSFL